MSSAVKLTCMLLLAGVACAQQPAPKPIRVGVAVMANVSTRPYPSRGPRDRLAEYLANQKPKRGQPAVEAVPLEAATRAAAEAEAAGKHCDYVVFTTLVALQALDEPPGALRVGIDPVPQPPGPPYPNSPVYVGVMKFELVRAGEPVLESSVRSGQKITAQDMITVLMSQVAQRVRKQIAKHP